MKSLEDVYGSGMIKREGSGYFCSSRIDQIDARLDQIRKEIDNPRSDLDVLNREIDSLLDEKKRISEEAAERRSMRAAMAADDKTKIVERMETSRIMEKRYDKGSEEYRIAWLKNLRNEEISLEARDAITATAAIPTITFNRVLDAMRGKSTVYDHVQQYHAKGGLKLPIESSFANASWLAMSAAATDDADALSAVDLTCKKLIKVLTIGADALRLSIDEFESYIVRRLAKSVIDAVDAAIINGTGSTDNEPIGILTGVTFSTASGNKVEIASSSSVTYDDITQLLATIPSDAAANAYLVSSRKMLYGELAAVKSSGSGMPLLSIHKDDANGIAGDILGYPVIVDDNVPDNLVLFGNLSGYAVNWGADLEITYNDGERFRYGDRVFRALALIDGAPVNTEAFGLMEHLTT